MKELLKNITDNNLLLEIVDGELQVYGSEAAPDPLVLSAITEHKQELIQFLINNDQRHFNKRYSAHISPAPAAGHYVLSSSQRRLWLICQSEATSITYNIPGIFEYQGYLDSQAFTQAFDQLLERHEILRTVFREDETGEPRQFILTVAEMGFSIRRQDLTAGNEAELNRLVQQDYTTPFDLSAGPLLRISLYELPGNKWVLTYVLHHIISDGWSMNILIREVMDLYRAAVQGVAAGVAPLRIQYKDYAVWQQEQLFDKALLADRQYWMHCFEQLPPVLQLQGDYPRPVSRTNRGNVASCRFNSQQLKGLKALCAEQGGTVFMGLLALVNTLLYRYTQQTDIVIGTPISGRNHLDLEDQIGFYVNMLALRTRFEGTDHFRALLQKVKKVTLDAYEHSNFPFDELVDALPLETDRSRHPLFDVAVVFQDASGSHDMATPAFLHMHGGAAVTAGAGKFDLCFNFIGTQDMLKVDIDYNADIFNADTVQRIAGHLQQLLQSATEDPLLPVARLSCLDTAEREQLLITFNNTAAIYPAKKTLVDLFEEQVAATGNHIALVADETLHTYTSLNERANRFAAYLSRHHHAPEDQIVGVRLEKGEALVVSILAVLKTGAAYLPIDPAYPQQRISYMIADAGCKVVIDEGMWSDFILHEQAYDPANKPYGVSADSLAYVIYTSGSTGQPKGVMITHKAVVNLVCAQRTAFGLGADENILQFSSPSFDAAVEQLFVGLTSGSRVTLVKQDNIDPVQLETFIIENHITHIHMVPAALKLLKPARYPHLRRVIAGGDKCSHELAAAWSRYYTFYNEYGPTETTVTSIEWCGSEGAAVPQTVPVGKPIANTTVYILQEYGEGHYELAPVGVAGEICIGGAGLARGYLGQPALTAMKFIPHPFIAGERLYKTGDLGKWLPDGNLVFIGRKDDQVKIRGYRIELGEIERTLQQYPGVDLVAVLTREEEGGDKSLIAFITAAETLDITVVKSFLQDRLPSFMLPGYLVQLDAMPFTSSGKIDRKALLHSAGRLLPAGETYVAPRNATEERLAQFWSQLLGMKAAHISIKDNFFDLGGHSLRAARLSALLHRDFEVKVTLKDIFSYPTLEEQALLVSGACKTVYKAITPAASLPHYPLSATQRRLWLLSQFEAASQAYNVPGIYVFRGALNREALSYALGEIVIRHESLRTVFRKSEAGETRQFILPATEVSLPIVYNDLRTAIRNGASPKEQVDKVLTAPFDLAEGPLLRVEMFRAGEDEWIFTFVMHHIISDGWSMNVLIKEVLLLYNARLKDEPYPLQPLSIQYKDYTCWHQELLSGEVLEAHKRYWLQQFSGEIPVLELPTDKIRPAFKTYKGAVVSRILGPEVSAGVRNLSQSLGASVFMGLLAAVKVLFYRYTGQEDIIIGTPMAGRDHAGLENQIGFYVNTLALRTRFKGSDDFVTVLEQVKQVTLSASEYQLYPFDDLVTSLQLQRDMSRHPLFDIQVILQQDHSAETVRPGLEGISVTNYEAEIPRSSVFDMVWMFTENAGGLRLEVTYNTDVYHREMVGQLATHLEQLLEAIIAAPQLPVSQLQYLRPWEQDWLVNGLNDTEVAYPPDATVLRLFASHVLQTPDTTALVYEGERLSYRQLDEQSSRLAGYLKETYQAGPGDKIGIMLERSPHLIVAILGVLKSGAAYVPIESSYPLPRKRYILEDTGARVLLTQTDHLFELDYFTGSVFAVDVQLGGLPVIIPQLPAVDETALAYVIYTSGSTGTPKGVMIQQQAIVNTIQSQQALFEAVPGDRHLQFAAASFDASVSEIFVSLCSGGTLYIVPEQVKQDPALLVDFINTNAIDIATLPPAYLHQADIPSLRRLKQLITAGEPAIGSDVNAFLAYSNYINAYGPTETSICASVYKLPKGGHVGTPEVPVGRPIANTSIYILDAQHNLLPAGVTGEIYVSGPGLALGYLNLPEQTAEKFVDNPFRPGTRMYRTGDLGRRDATGNIVFAGRKDEQVKIRGYRIELKEIESCLLAYEGVSAAAITVVESGGDKTLAAYLVAGDELDAAALRTYVSQQLPVYMHPGHYVQLDALPLTSSGKTDKQALPNPQDAGVLTDNVYVAPGKPAEATLANIWAQVLEKEQVGITNGFFELGGDSIKVLRMLARVEKELHLRIPVEDVYRHDTIEKLCAQVLEHKASIEKGEGAINALKSVVEKELDALKRHVLECMPEEELENIEDIYPMSDIEKGMVFESLRNTNKSVYHDQVVHRRFFADFDIRRFTKAMELLVEKHAILRTAFNLTDYATEVQIVYRKGPVPVDYRDISLLPQEEQVRAIQGFIDAELGTPFVFHVAPLWRMMVFNCGNNELIFIFQCHHSIIDGWSDATLMTALNNLYLQLGEDPSYKPSPLVLTYRDFIIQHETDKRDETIKQFWRNELADYTRMNLFTEEDAADNYLHLLDREVVHMLEAAAANLNTTVKELSLCAYFYTIRILGYRHDITTGVVTNTRPNVAESDEILGCFLNTMPVKISIPGNISCADYVKLVHDKMIGLKKYERLSVLEISRILNQQSNTVNPFFDVLFDYVDFHVYDGVKNNSVVEQAAAPVRTAAATGIHGNAHTNTFLDFIIERTGGGYNIILRLKKQLRSGFTVEKIGTLYENILRYIALHPNGQVADIPYLGVDEKNQLVDKFNDTVQPYPAGETVLHLFRKVVQQSPSHAAVNFQDVTLTYRELDEMSDRLAAHFITHYQVSPGDLAGILLDRSDKMIVAILAVLKAGAAYVPIDPEYPKARQEFILEDTGAGLLITETAYLFGLEFYTGNVFAIDIQLGMTEALEAPLTWRAIPANPSYVIYTSGSTGLPKGCYVTGANLYNYVQWANSYYFNTVDKPNFPLFTSLSFDLTVTSIFCTLTSGGTLTVFGQHQEMADVFRAIFSESSAINCIKLTPAHISMLTYLHLSVPNIALAIVGGEQVAAAHVEVLKQINPDMRVFNEYGPTEATVGCIVKELAPEEPVLIGNPIANTRVYILNSDLQLAPLGVPGEIYIGGMGVAAGYYRNPQLSSEKFIPDPFCPGEKMYATGDMGRWLDNGEIAFLGRKDEQLKIRGYRIEPAEIERVLLSCPGVEAAVVMAWENGQGAKELVAYLAGVTAMDHATLRASLAAELPDYMLPVHYIQLPELPLTVNGKTDRAKLPSPAETEDGRASAYVAPTGKMEIQLAHIWEKVLGREQIGLHDSFFAAGGDSIKVLRMLSEMEKEMGLRMPVADIYQYDTISGIMGHLQKHSTQLEQRMQEAAVHRAAAIKRINTLKEQISRLVPDPDNIEDIYPMSDIEKGMVFESLVDESLHIYHDQMMRHRVFPAFDLDRFRHAVSLLVEKHAILRTGFNLADYEREVQIVYKKVDYNVSYEDISSLPRDQQEAAVRQYMQCELERHFNVMEPPLWRMAVFYLGKDEIVLVFQCHHAIIDGWSDALLMTELNNLYLRLEEDPAYIPVPLQASYRDFIIQHEADRQDENIRGFWRSDLAAAPRLSLFTEEENVVRHLYRMDGNTLQQLRQTAEQLGTTVKVISLAAYLFMLRILGNSREIVTGLVTNTRPNCVDSDRILGCFLNTIPLKMEVDGNTSCASFIKAVAGKLLSLKDKENISLLEIAKITGNHTSAGNPFFDQLFNYVDFNEYLSVEHAAAEMPAATLSEFNIAGNIRGNTYFDFLIDCTLGSYTIVLIINKQFKCGFSPGRIIDLYSSILQHMLQHPDAPVKDAAYISNEEKEQLLSVFNNTAGDYPMDKTIIDLFMEQVASTPDKTAVVFGEQVLPYAQLDKISSQLAAYLRSCHAIRPNDLVGIRLERSEWLLIAILGILKSGAAYMPLDPAYPQERIDYMTAHSRCVTIIDESALAAFRAVQDDMPDTVARYYPAPKDLAYVIYTSGSTGKPKGVMIPHGNVVNFFAGLNQVLPLEKDECMLAVTSTSFDISVLELLWTLCNGVSVVIHSAAHSLQLLDRYVQAQDTDLDFSLFFFSSYNNEEETGRYNLLLEAVKYADTCGFKAVWTPERHFHEFGGLYPNPAVLSAALAMVTRQIALRSGSVVAPLHDPVRIAEEWSVVDNLSNGRIGLSFASGWNPDDFILAKDHFRDRHTLLYEQVAEVKRLWKGESIHRMNGAGRETAIHIFPRPIQQDLPIWITSAGNAQTFIKAGQHGANVLTHLLGQEADQLEANIRLYRQARQEHGFDPDTGVVTVMVHTYIGEDINEVESLVEAPFIEYLKSAIGLNKMMLEGAGIREEDLTEEVKRNILKNAFLRYYKSSALIGTPSSCAPVLQKLRRIGVNEVACLVDFGLDSGTVMKGLEHLATLKSWFSQSKAASRQPRITMMQSTPSFIKLLEEDAGSRRLLGSLRTLLIGGEPLPVSLAQRIRQQYPADVYNMYGPTETTIWSCVYPVNPQIQKMLVGKPLLNQQVHILDDDGQLLPVGIIGEVYIGGKGVAPGYLYDPELTATRFVKHPFTAGEMLYKTGDLGRWLPDGTLELAGRKDEQVKINGYRIELGEIESALTTFDNIQAAVAATGINRNQEKILLAYVVSDQPLDMDAVRMHLARLLPYYMLPAYIIQLEEIPLTPNGKVDRRGLPGPQLPTDQEESNYIAPQTATEEKLVAIWQEVLGGERVGATDDYFELGGNSLRAMRLVKRIMDELAVSLPLTVLFMQRTVRNIARYIDDTLQTDAIDITADPEAAGLLVPASYNQLMYFSQWFAAQNHNVVTIYEYQHIDIPALRMAILQLIARHEILRTVFVSQGERILQRILTMEELNFTVPEPVIVHHPDELAGIEVAAHRHAFDLFSPPLLFVNICRYKDKYHIVVAMHHIISDGYSSGITTAELPVLYQACLEGRESPLKPLIHQYRHFSSWQHQFLRSAEGTAHRQYWLNRLSGLQQQLSLTILDTVSFSMEPNIVNVVSNIAGARYEALQQFSREQGLTKTVIMLGLLAVTFHRFCGQQDITIATSVSGRNSRFYGDMEIGALFGNFTNMILVRNTVDAENISKDFLQEVQQRFLEDLSYDAYPVEKLVTELAEGRAATFFDGTVLLNYHNYDHPADAAAADVPEEGEQRLPADVAIRQCFMLLVTEYRHQLRLHMAFNEQLLSAADRKRIRELFLAMLDDIISCSE